MTGAAAGKAAAGAAAPRRACTRRGRCGSPMMRGAATVRRKTSRWPACTCRADCGGSAAKEVKQAVTKYEWYKAHGICPTCGCRDAAPGRVQCPECLEKERLKAVQRRKKESPEQKEYHNRHRQRRTDLLHAFGVCVRCQRRDAAPGRAQCVYCLARSRRYMQSRLREKGVMPRDMLGWPGICSRCGKPTDTQEAHKLCPACREASQRSMEIARNSRTEKNWFARTHSLMAWGNP